MLQHLAMQVSQRLDRIDFSVLTPPMRRYGFALYNREAVCLNGRLLPVTDAFRGNTAILYEGVRIAIWDVGSDPVDDPDTLTSCIVHEMRHCQQHECATTRWPDDLAMLALEETPACDGLRAAENRLLQATLESGDPAPWDEFLRLRARRRLIAPALCDEEEKVEALEGGAEFTALCALRMLDEGKFRAALARLCQHLATEDERFFDRRRMAYHTGTAILLCLARQGLDADALTRAAPADTPIPPLPPALHHARTQLHDARHRRLEALLQGARAVPCQARIIGYDPMNMYRVGDALVCEHFVILQGESGPIPLMHPVVLTLAPGAANVVAACHIQ